jgi:hypothetical protein
MLPLPRLRLRVVEARESEEFTLMASITPAEAVVRPRRLPDAIVNPDPAPDVCVI